MGRLKHLKQIHGKQAPGFQGQQPVRRDRFIHYLADIHLRGGGPQRKRHSLLTQRKWRTILVFCWLLMLALAFWGILTELRTPTVESQNAQEEQSASQNSDGNTPYA